MCRYAARALPWLLIGVTAMILFGLMALVRAFAWTLWPLQGVGVGLVAAAAGWCLDEPAAAVVDAAPRGLAWRTGVRTTGIASLLATWTAAVCWAGDALFGHPGAVLVQGYGAAAIGGAWATWRRSRGEATPGQRWAIAVVPVSAAWALVRPWEERLPVFPYADGPTAGWAASTAGWLVATAAALLVLAWTLSRAGRPLAREAPYRR